MEMIDRYRRWFEYEKDAHLKVLASFESVPGVNRAAPEFQTAIDLCAHVAAARKMWLSRFRSDIEPPKELFPTGIPLADLRPHFDAVHNLWSAHLAGMNESDLTRAFEYTASEGTRYRSVIEDVFTQLFGHSLYHRGQVASIIRSLGGEPAVTDFIFWTREAI